MRKVEFTLEIQRIQDYTYYCLKPKNRAALLLIKHCNINVQMEGKDIQLHREIRYRCLKQEIMNAAETHDYEVIFEEVTKASCEEQINDAALIHGMECLIVESLS